ncbi:PorV/PorQ family protein [candidate division WOR-3 bacterium]|nr:PorV/PorQ family protein [candidate division WOR-3 bacterium]
MKKVFVLGLLIATASFAQFSGSAGTTADPLLKIGFGPRAAAMGSAYAGLASDINALWWNPAGLYQLSSSELLLTHQEWMAGIRDEYVAFGWPVSEKNSLGLALNFSSVTGIEYWDDSNQPGNGGAEPTTIMTYESMFCLGYARKIGERFGLGFSLKGIYEDLYNASGFGGAADLGIHMRSTSAFSWGVVLQNVGLVEYGGVRRLTPIQARIGAALSYPDYIYGVNLAADVRIPFDNIPSFHVGVEISHFDIIVTRVGYQTGPQDIAELSVFSGLTGGVGLNIKNLRVDYCINPYGKLGIAHRLGIIYAFGERVWLEGSRNDREEKVEAFAAVEPNESCNPEPDPNVTYAPNPSSIASGSVTRILNNPAPDPVIRIDDLDNAELPITVHSSQAVAASDGVSYPASALENVKESEDVYPLPLRSALQPSIAVLPDQYQQTECLVTHPYGLFIENNGSAWDVINMDVYNSLDPEFTTEICDTSGKPLPDVDGDGRPDTDTLPQGGTFEVLAEVTPVDKLPFGYTDTCFFSGQSVRNPDWLDTAVLVTTIRQIEVSLDSNMTLEAYPADVAVFNLEASHTSLYRADTLNFNWWATQPETSWPIRVTDEYGTDLEDSDDDDNLVDIADVAPDDPPLPVPLQVRVGVPYSAVAGDADTIYLEVTSANYPADYDYPQFEDIYEEVRDTVELIVRISAVPGIRIRPNQIYYTNAGDPARHTLEVINNGNGPDIPNIDTTLTQSGWTHELFDNDGNPLQDTNGDLLPDIGSLAGSGGVDTVYLDVTPPFTSREGDVDTTVVYARSTVDPEVYDSAVCLTVCLFPITVDVKIWPDTCSAIGPGESAVYDSLKVANYGEYTDTIRCWTAPVNDLGWDAELTFSDGSPLRDADNDGFEDLGAVSVLDTVYLKLVVTPTADLGCIVGKEFDTSMVELRYVWIETGFAADTSVRDSVLITTVLEPDLDVHNYPNPFSGPTTFVYSIPRAGLVTLQVYNRAGEHIRTLFAEKELEYGGTFEETWDGMTENGRKPSPGVYLYVLEWKEEKEGGSFASISKRIVKKALLQP